MKKKRKVKNPSEQDIEEWKKQRELRPNGRPDKEQAPESPQQK